MPSDTVLPTWGSEVSPVVLPVEIGLTKATATVEMGVRREREREGGEGRGTPPEKESKGEWEEGRDGGVEGEREEWRVGPSERGRGIEESDPHNYYT